ncbi:ABC-2 type transport system ATP-binding protein [Paucimonas lemoignei]|uniref:ABC-2 type transport system ATP-binding protein n=1 Tax=Paucimonas lemoignei TaxID=29443 RepID=A0A4V2UIJ0_PAULE|nr:ABC transporter ATP-binding protein [Paucimonas lemoignei]TCS36340.1 ABC-2 type transport system ATP-binding protein [Paucimonas lemoignei]
MLSLRDLRFTYPNAARAALAGVSFNVNRGEIVGLLGPNGAGKTTLISHLAGMLPMQHGEIRVGNDSLAQARKKRPSCIAIAPQEYAFYPTLTVRENLQCFGAVSSSSNLKPRIERASAFAQLEQFNRQQARTLSGGLKRRLNLAIATLAEPDYILLDEPTVGVDPQSRAFLLDAVRQLAQEGVGIIYTSHYMEEVEALADRVVIIDHGAVLRHGTLDELLSQGHPVLKFLQAGLTEQAVSDILQPFGTMQSPHQLLLRAGSTPSQALNALELAGAQITHAEFGRFNLEQLFMQLTQRSLRD